MAKEYQSRTDSEYLRNRRMLVGLEFAAQDNPHRIRNRTSTIRLARISRQTRYYIPQDIASKYCAQVREEMTGHWLNRQWWQCKRCMLKSRGGLPAGLITPMKNHYKCKAIAMRYGHQIT